MAVYKLKSLTKMPPKGWSYFQPETGWRMPAPLTQSYATAVQMIIKHRMANPAKMLSTDPTAVGAQLQNFIAHQIAFDPNWVELADPEAKKKLQHPGFLQKLSANVRHAVDEIRATLVGAKILAAWLGDGGHPVAIGEAQERANICLKCPNNKPHRGRLKYEVAAAILQHEKTKSELSLKVENEGALKTCAVCKCHLPLKVWVPQKHLTDTTSADQFPDFCWIVNPPLKKRKVVIRRKSAFGDVIQATALATKLKAQNVEIEWETDDPIIPILINHPDIVSVGPLTDRPVDVELTATYEHNPERSHKHIADLYLDAANPQLEKAGLAKVERHNWFPKLTVNQEAKAKMFAFMSKFQRPWIVINPRSNSWKNREVPFEVWAKAKDHVQGTFFWVGTEACRTPIIHLGCQGFSEVVGAIANADVVATVDTGPMHAAAALKIPLVVVQQSFRIDLRLTDQMDYITTSADIACLGCDQYQCPKPAPDKSIPCCHPDPDSIANAINRKLYKTGSVSAVIPVYSLNMSRLNRCIASIADQVDEVVVVLDGNARLDMATSPALRIVKSTGKRIGFGKTCNRGVRESSGEFVLLLNDDCYMQPHAVSQMLVTMSKEEKAAVVGCLLRYPNGTIQHGGTVPTGPLQWGHVDHGQREPSIKDVTEMDYVTFAAVLIRRKAFYQAQGFDEQYDSYNTDSDLCLTIRKLGWRVLYNPKAEGIHEESQTTSPMKGKLSTEDQAVMNMKWRGNL